MKLFKQCATCGGDGDIIVDLDCGCCCVTRDCDTCDGVGFYEIDWPLTDFELREILAALISKSGIVDTRAQTHLREAYSFLF